MPPAMEPLAAKPCHAGGLEQTLSLLLLRAGVGDKDLGGPVLHG